MKKATLCMLGLAAAVAVAWSLSGVRADAQTPPAAGTQLTTIGRMVEIQVVTWPLSTTPAGKVEGTLVSVGDQWVIVQSGTSQLWVARDKVMVMKVLK